MTQQSTNLIRALRSCFAELDDIKDASERSAIYEHVGAHLRSAAPITWVQEMEMRIAASLDEQKMTDAAAIVRGGKWRGV